MSGRLSAHAGAVLEREAFMIRNEFDTEIAATYDADSGRDRPEDLAPVVDLLADLAGDGAALEFALGTGRVALPLAARGVPVRGIEYSQAMLDEFARKPGADAVPCALGDMAQTRMDGEFSLVYLVFNTIMNLTSQAAQVACFRNAAAHLVPGGHFVVEVMVPQLRRLAPGERFVAWEISDRHWGVDEYELPGQRLTSHHLRQRPDGLQRRSIPFRYVFPDELDLMAQLAGMEPVSRCADWRGAAFTSDSAEHVSVWRKC
jgi:hypothetical protein